MPVPTVCADAVLRARLLLAGEASLTVLSTVIRRVYGAADHAQQQTLLVLGGRLTLVQSQLSITSMCGIGRIAVRTVSRQQRLWLASHLTSGLVLCAALFQITVKSQRYLSVETQPREDMSRLTQPGVEDGEDHQAVPS